MARKLICITLITVTIMGTIGFMALTEPVNVNAAITSDNLGWTDNFDSATLDSRWYWVRENPTYWSLTTNPGSLHLVTRGSLNEASNNLENILLTPESDLDYRIVTKVTFAPIENYHRAGLLVYQDDDNYMQLTRVYSDGDHVRIKTEIGGVASYIYAANAVSATTLYLRIDRYGNDYYGFYSLDESSWEFVGQHNLLFTNPSVGLMAAYGPTVTEISADFDYFQFMPRAFNNSWGDDFNRPALDSAWSWKNEDPTHWSLSANPGFLQIITQNGSVYSGIYHNLLLTAAPADEYRITTRASISPTENYQCASIIVYGDDSNYIRLGRRFANSGQEINFRQEKDGALADNMSIPETATTVYLRIIREGDVYMGYYSVDGISYNYIGRITAAIANTQVGIVSENGPSTTEISSDYDFFLLENNLHWIYLPLVIKQLLE